LQFHRINGQILDSPIEVTSIGCGFLINLLLLRRHLSHWSIAGLPVLVLVTCKERRNPVQEDLHDIEPGNASVTGVEWTLPCIHLQDRDTRDKARRPILHLQSIIFKPLWAQAAPQDTNFRTTMTSLEQQTVETDAPEFGRGSRGYAPGSLISNCVGR